MTVIIAAQLGFFIWMMFIWDGRPFMSLPQSRANDELVKNLKPIEVKSDSMEAAVLNLYNVRKEMAFEEYATDIVERDMAQLKLESVTKMSESGSASARQVSEAKLEVRRAELNVKYSKLAIEEAKHQHKIVEEAVLSGKFCPTVSTDFDIRQRRPR